MDLNLRNRRLSKVRRELGFQVGEQHKQNIQKRFRQGPREVSSPEAGSAHWGCRGDEAGGESAVQVSSGPAGTRDLLIMVWRTPGHSRGTAGAL